jgi:hypothetical protein
VDVDDWRAVGEREMLRASLLRNGFLVGLVEQWGAEQVEFAALHSPDLGYPASMVGTHAEARAIQSFLQQHERD